jgi:hypothetical protein
MAESPQDNHGKGYASTGGCCCKRVVVFWKGLGEVGTEKNRKSGPSVMGIIVITE